MCGGGGGGGGRGRVEGVWGRFNTDYMNRMRGGGGGGGAPTSKPHIPTIEILYIVTAPISSPSELG